MAGSNILATLLSPLLLSSILLHYSCPFPLQASAAQTYPASKRTHHTAQVSSLLPPSVCNRPSTTRGIKVGALEVVHKHGPCSQMSKDKVDSPTTLAQTLAQDQLRVDSIQSIFSKSKSRPTLADSRTTITAVSGRPLGTGNFIVKVGLGTPTQKVTLAFDTASALTWTQCLPCAKRGCYTQKDPIFNPEKSGSYRAVSCNSSKCSDIASSTTFPPGCSSGSGKCTYGLQYGDGSTTDGILAEEKLSLTARDSVEKFVFGCGQNNTGLYGETAGLLGLTQDKVSLVSQAAYKFGRVFSYCLPSTGSVGSLTFGSGGTNGSAPLTYTPLSSRKGRRDGFYYLDLTGIDVGGKPVPISAAELSRRETIIDSGTVVTRLPPAIYSALKSAFTKQMSNYTLTQPFGIFDTCYDLSQFDTVSIPTVKLNFRGNAAVAVDVLGTITGPAVDQLCLAFAGNEAEDDLAIIGNLQQLTYDVVYDVDRKRVGFGAGGCS